MVNCQLVVASFSPHNGEVILKAKEMSDLLIELHEFQSPQWGDNSKAVITWSDTKQPKGFSPRNGEVILKRRGS